MRDGIIQQVDTPQNLYDAPCNLFVAGFIGTPQMNFTNGKLVLRGQDLYATFGATELKLPAEKANNPALKEYIGQEVIFGVRPEAAQYAGSNAYGINGIPQIILFGPDGTILKRNLRGAAIEEAVKEVLE